MRASKTVWTVLACVLILGCREEAQPDPGAAVMATAYGDVLTLSDLLAEMPPALSVADSTIWANRIIADWQQRRTVVHLAKTELPENDRNVDLEVRRYRDALYIHAYEDRYLRDHLDTVVTPAEVEAFLKEEPDLFRLESPLYRARWMAFPPDLPFPADILDWEQQLASRDPEVLSSLSSRCTDAGLPFDLDAERWWTWSELSAVLPLDPASASRLQRTRDVNRLFWPADTAAGRPSDQRALLLITDRLAAGAATPMERVADRVGELILHRRRNRTLATMRQQAVEAAWAEAALTTASPDDTP